MSTDVVIIHLVRLSFFFHASLSSAFSSASVPLTMVKVHMMKVVKELQHVETSTPSFIRSTLVVFVRSIKFSSSFESEADLELFIYSEFHFKRKKIMCGKEDDDEGISNRKPCNSCTHRCRTYTFTQEEENQKIQIRLIDTSGIDETLMDFLEMNRI